MTLKNRISGLIGEIKSIRRHGIDATDGAIPAKDAPSIERHGRGVVGRWIISGHW